MTEGNLEKLVESRDILSYSYSEVKGCQGSHGGEYLQLISPSGACMGIGSWSTPTPETSGLTIDVY
jgi:hypothetical protein